jgi:TPR repeat protein
MHNKKSILCVAAVLFTQAVLALADEPIPSPSLAPAETASVQEASPADETPKPPDRGAEKFWSALSHFRSKSSADLAVGRAELEAAAADEFTHAQLMLGECYQAGSYGFPVNPRKGANYYQLAAARGNAFAKVSYGMCLFSGVGVRKNFNAAAEWLIAALAPDADFSRPEPPADFFTNASAVAAEDSVAGGTSEDPVASAQARAHYILGVILEAAKKPAEAQAHYVAAANAGPGGKAGVQQAALQAAVNYAFGRGVPRDSAKANEMLAKTRTLARRTGISTVHDYATAKLVDDFAVSEMEEAVAKASDEIAGDVQLNIARQFTDRKSKDYNPKEAVQWFELAAESGRAWAMLELGLLYSRGDLGKPEPEKAFVWFERAGGGEKPKHYLALANLVICYENGIGTAKDSAKAREIAGRHKSEELVCHLELTGRCPNSILDYEQALALNQRWAGEGKDPQAQYLMGLRYESGYGVKANIKTAASWYKKGAMAKHGPSSRQLAILYQFYGSSFGLGTDKAYAKAAEYYRAGADAGDAIATAGLATMTVQGLGVPRSEENAKELYEKSLAIDPKLTLALNNLALIYEKRFREARAGDQAIVAELNRTMMLDLLRKGDDAGYDLAAYNLGRLYHEGVLGKPDLEKAYGYYEKAAERGHSEARFLLGKMHEYGEGVPVGYVEAAYHYRLAALANHVGALRRLVAFYMEGRGGTQDLDRAQFWLLRLANLQAPDALAALADIAIQQKKYAQAIKLLEMLRSNFGGDLQGIAYERLSRCYRDGLGVKTNPKKAQQYLQKALDLKNPDAQCRLAKNLLGKGKLMEGLKWYEEAARNSGAANFALGQIYFFGQGVEPNRGKADDYLRRAASRSFPDALYFLAAMTYKNEEGAPKLDEAIQFATNAEAMAFPNAAELREKLEQRRKSGDAKS